MNHGLHTDIPASVYHADPCDTPSLSSGIAKILLERPPLWAWAAHPKLNPDHQPSAPKAAFDLGHAAHAALLEECKGITVCEFDNWLTKDAKAARDAARATGNTPVLAADFAEVREMARIATVALKAINVAVSDTLNECTMIGEVDGVLCRTRPDIYQPGLIIDYKTTSRPLDGFPMQAAKYGYDLQAAMYMAVAKSIGKPCEWMFLVQETTAPYPVQIFKPTREFLEVGKRKFQEALATWKNCMETNEWPGYDQEVQLLDAMPWDLNDLATESEEKLLQEFDK